MKMPRKRKVPVPVIAEENETDAEVSTNTTVHNGPMYTIMSHVQLNETFHKKYIREMHQVYQKMDHDAFMFMFIKMVKSAMEADETNEYAYTTLLFCARFVASYDVDDTHPVLIDTCRWLLTTMSQNPHIRFRLCQFVNMILNALGTEAALDDAICDGIMEYMLRRLRDINPNVRVQAILALQRLQCPDNPDDIVLRVYQFHLCSDPSPRVRQAVVTSMGRNYSTIPYILDRLWDIDEKVRRHTYLHMSGYPVKAYKVSQRLQLLEQGLNDRSEMVKKVVTTIMLPQWLESYNKNYILFVSALKLDASEAEVERFLKIAKVALSEIFKRQKKEDLVSCVPLEEDGEFHKCVPHDKLSMEVTLYWQCLIEHLQASMADELDMIIPELSTFCAYVLKFCESQKSATDKFMKMEFQYVLLSLCEILYLYDLGDEIGRENLKKLIFTILISNDLEEKIIEVIVKCTENLITDQNSRLQFFVEIIEEITQTSSFKNDTLINDRVLIDELLEKHSDKDLKLKLSSLKVKILDLEEQEMNFVEQKDYVQAHRITEEKTAYTEEYSNLLKPLLDKHKSTLESSSEQSQSVSSRFQQTKKVTSETILKCLQLAFYMVVSKNVKTLTPNVCKMYNEFIGRHIASNQIAIRDWALKCGTAYSMLYEALAKEIYEVLYAQFFKNHNIRIWKTSITCIFELLDRYGCSSFNVEERQSKNKRNGRQLYNTLEFLDADEDTSVWSSGQAVDIIFMMSHFLDTCDDVCIISAIVNGFCRLVLHDHIKNPEILEKLLLRYFNPSTDAEINQILGVFLENLIQRKKQEYLHPCLLPTVSQVISAPYESPLHEIKPETMLRFVIDATRPEFCAPGANIHNKLAHSFLQEMQNNIANKDLCKILSKELLTLEMSMQDEQEFKVELKGIAEKLIKCELDARTLKNLIDFKDLLDGVFNPPLRRINLDGSDDEDKSDDENGSAVTTEKEFEKVSSNDTNSNRLVPVLEEENELETLAEEVDVLPENNQLEKDKENTEEIVNSTEKRDSDGKKKKKQAATKKTVIEKENDPETLTEVSNGVSAEDSPIEKDKTAEKENTEEIVNSTEKRDSDGQKKKSPEKKQPANKKSTRKAKEAEAEKEIEPSAEPPPPVVIEPTTVDPPPSSQPTEIVSSPASVSAVVDPSSASRSSLIDQQKTPLSPARQITTPTTYGRENSTGLRYLRKSMNSSRQNTQTDDGPSPKIRIEARIDTIVSPLKVQSTTEKLRSTRLKFRALARNDDEKQSSTTKKVQSSKKKLEARKAATTPTRKTTRNRQKEKEPSSSEEEEEVDSDESEVIPPSPTSTDRVTDATVSTLPPRRFNRALRLNNSQKPPATPSAKATRSNRKISSKTASTEQPPSDVLQRNPRKRPISPVTKGSNESGNEYSSPLRKQSKTDIHISENTTKTTNLSANKESNNKQQTPVTNELRAKNSNVPEKTIEQKKKTRGALKKTNSPSSKENEPSQSSSSFTSSEDSSSSASDNEKGDASFKSPPTSKSAKKTTTVTNELRAKNSNVPEKTVEQKKKTRGRPKKTNSPSSKENEPKSHSPSSSSFTSSEDSSSSASDDEQKDASFKSPPTAKTAKKKNLTLTKSTEKRMTKSKNPVLSLRRTNTSSSANKVSTRNSARKARQNNMIMTRKRLSLENIRKPTSRQLLFPVPKTPTPKKSTGAPKVSKIPVNIALRTNKSNINLEKSKSKTSISGISTTSSTSNIATESESDSEKTTSTWNKGNEKKSMQSKAPVQTRNASSSTTSQKLASFSRIARSTRNTNSKSMLGKRNI